MKSSQTSSSKLSKTPSKLGKELRLNRFLADCGLGSRRKTEELILSGKVMVNGQICTELSKTIDVEKDEVSYEGKVIKPSEEKLYLILNKPAGYVVSQKDEYDRKTVYELLPDEYRNLPYAGRLDKNSEGLLLFSNDGDMINKLTHPKNMVEKVYRVSIEPPLKRKEIQALRDGVMIEGGITQRAKVYVKSQTDEGMTLRIIIYEGRKRQIRQMIEAVGAKVISLRRVQFGPLILKDLPKGRWRPLLPAEIHFLRKVINQKENIREKKI